MSRYSLNKPMFRLWLLALGVQFLTACSDSPQPTKPIGSGSQLNQLEERLNKAFDAALVDQNFMGNVALLDNGQLQFSRSTGFADISNKLVANSSTKYRLGSISKTYTAVMIFKAIDQGKLSLEQTIETFFPALENAAQIRIVDLLQHRSGIASFTKDPSFFSYHTAPQSQQQMLKTIFSLQSEFIPGSSAEYSNSNYYLLAYILEQIHDKPLAKILQEQIASPLGLSNTYIGRKVTPEHNESYSYYFDSAWQLMPQTDMSVTFGAGDVVATAEEVARFLDALFTGRLLSAQYVAAMQTINDGFGMGLMRYELSGRVGFGHRGTLDGYRSTAIYFPDHKLTLVVTANGDTANKDTANKDHDNINRLFEALLKAYFNDPVLAISDAELDKYIGTYISTTDSSDIVVFVREGNQLIHVIQEEFKQVVTYKGERQFLFEQMYGPAILFTFSEDGAEVLLKQGTFSGSFSKRSIE